MNLKKLQEEQMQWVKHNFGDRPAWQPLMGITEEFGELAEAIGWLNHSFLKYNQRIRREENHIENMKDAVGDIVIYLADFCTAMGFDFSEIVTRTWQEVKKRDWKKYPKNGLTK